MALVVGMAGYSNGVPALRNPLNDIAAVVASFRDLGFAVYYVADGSAQAVTDCARRARAEHPDPQVSIFYYAGHGIQIEDENFLVATDADLTQDGDKGFLPVEEVLQTMRAGNGATLIFLDACRDNPFGAGGPSGLSPSTGRGITVAGTGGVSPTGGDKVQARGISVSYSTSPNAVAQDGDGELSPFATAITGYIGQPGHSLQRVMSAVNNAVGEATDWTQTPWTRSSLTAELKLAGSMTVEEARAASENWARRSRQFLETGRRLDAIAAALKGIPAYAGEAGAKRDYALAHEALVNAYLSGNSVASDEIAKRDRHLDHGSWMSPDRKFYASAWASERLFFTLHRSDDGEKIATLIDGQDTADYLTKVAYSSDRRFLAGGISDLTIWDVRTGEKLKNFANSPLGFFTFSPNSTSLLSVELYGDNIQVMSAENGGLLAELNLEKLKKASPELSEFLKGHNGSKVVAGYAGDDRICIATIGGNERDSILPVSVGFYDLKSGRYEMAGVAHAEKAWILNTINCSADGRWAAIGASDEAAPAHVHVWDARRGEVVADIATDGDEGNALFHSGSRQLAIDMGSGDLRCRGWQVCGASSRRQFRLAPGSLQRRRQVRGRRQPADARLCLGADAARHRSPEGRECGAFTGAFRRTRQRARVALADQLSGCPQLLLSCAHGHAPNVSRRNRSPRPCCIAAGADGCGSDRQIRLGRSREAGVSLGRDPACRRTDRRACAVVADPAAAAGHSDRLPVHGVARDEPSHGVCNTLDKRSRGAGVRLCDLSAGGMVPLLPFRPSSPHAGSRSRSRTAGWRQA